MEEEPSCAFVYHAGNLKNMLGITLTKGQPGQAVLIVIVVGMIELNPNHFVKITAANNISQFRSQKRIKKNLLNSLNPSSTSAFIWELTATLTTSTPNYGTK